MLARQQIFYYATTGHFPSTDSLNLIEKRERAHAFVYISLKLNESLILQLIYNETTIHVNIYDIINAREHPEFSVVSGNE